MKEENLQLNVEAKETRGMEMQICESSEVIVRVERLAVSNTMDRRQDAAKIRERVVQKGLFVHLFAAVFLQYPEKEESVLQGTIISRSASFFFRSVCSTKKLIVKRIDTVEQTPSVHFFMWTAPRKDHLSLAEAMQRTGKGKGKGE